MNTEETYRASVYNTALSRLNEKVRGGIDLGLNLVEAGQTGRMLRSLANFRQYVSDIRRGNIIPYGGSSRDIANGWLQFQYGWRPLLSDIFKVLDEGNRIVLNAIERVSASAKQPLSGSVKTETVHGIPGCAVTHSTTGKMACTIHMKYSVSQGFDLSRWTSLNPVSLTWEVIPYSFVVDWFLDVSSFLRNLETAVLYNAVFMGGYVSELFVDETQCYLPYKVNVTGNNRDELFNVMGSYRKVWFNRSVLSSYPLPRRPSFEVKLGWQRLVSAGALVRQVFK